MLRAFVLLNAASPAASAPRKINISESTHKPPQTPPEPPTTPPKAATDAEGNEICLFFLCRHCSFKGTVAVGRAEASENAAAGPL